jgi:hypothetical protein
VSQAWCREVQPSLNPLTALHTKLSRTAKALRAWSKSLIPQPILAMAVCREIIHRLESAQESRHLSSEERQLLSTLKFRVMGLAAIEKSRARQKSRLTWLRKGDANTNTFNSWPILGSRGTTSKHSKGTIMWQRLKVISRSWFMITSCSTLDPMFQEHATLTSLI